MKYIFLFFMFISILYADIKITYYDDVKRTVASKISYKNGIKHGPFKQYREDGLLEYEGNYKDGKFDRIVKEYYERIEPLTLKKEVSYKNGIIDGFYRRYYYLDGHMDRETPYLNGKKHGVEKGYKCDLKPTEEGNDRECQWRLLFENSYKNGVKHGVTKKYDEDGHPIYEKIYEDGKLVSTKKYKNGKLKSAKTYKDGKSKTTETYKKSQNFRSNPDPDLNELLSGSVDIQAETYDIMDHPLLHSKTVIYNPLSHSNDKKLKVLNYKNDCKNNNGIACLKLGALYYIGDGVEQNYFEARRYFRESCRHSHYTSSVLACYMLAILYIRGEGGMIRDYSRAKKITEDTCSRTTMNGNRFEEACKLYDMLKECD